MNPDGPEHRFASRSWDSDTGDRTMLASSTTSPASDQFGQVYYLHATRTNLGPIRQDVNAVWDLAPHDIAIFNYLLDDRPLWASAIGTRVLKTSRDDIAFATLGYKNGVVGNIHVSWSDPNKAREVVAGGGRPRGGVNALYAVECGRDFQPGG